MPFALQSINKVALDGTLASCTFRRKESQIVLFTVREIVMNHVPILVKGIATLSAEKVSWMPVLSQCSQTFLSDGDVVSFMVNRQKRWES
jgi:hypothetical protein